jgi:hypothetical protein
LELVTGDPQIQLERIFNWDLDDLLQEPEVNGLKQREEGVLVYID